MRTTFLLTLSILASTVPAVADLPPSLGDDYPISFWCGPTEKFTTVEQYRRIADAGFTFVMPPCGSANSEIDYKTLDSCQPVGLHAFLQDPRMPLGVTGIPDAKSRLDAIIADYSKPPALAGYFIADEPGAGSFPGLA